MNAFAITDRRRGFTIVELLIVVVVIAILAAITIISYTGITKQAKETTLLSAVDTYEKALMMHKAEKGVYPSTRAPEGSSAVFAFACLGDDYPATSNLELDYCSAKDQNFSENLRVWPDVNNDLRPYLGMLPSVGGERSITIGSGDLYVRGVWYLSDGVTGQILYMNGENAACGRGSYILIGGQIPACQVVLR